MADSLTEDVAAPAASDPIAAWEEQHAKEVQAKDEKESHDLDALKAKAEQDLAFYYEQRKATIDSRKKTNRENEEAMKASAGVGSEWERAVNMLDLQIHADRRDTSRMKQVLFRLKNQT